MKKIFNYIMSLFIGSDKGADLPPGVGDGLKPEDAHNRENTRQYESLSLTDEERRQGIVILRGTHGDVKCQRTGPWNG